MPIVVGFCVGSFLASASGCSCDPKKESEKTSGSATKAATGEEPTYKNSDLSPLYRVELGQVHLNHGGYLRAAKQFEKAADEVVKPEQKADLYRRAADALERAGDMKGAKRMYAAGDKHDASDKEISLESAERRLRTAQYAKAEEIFDTLMKRSRDSESRRRARAGLLRALSLQRKLGDKLDVWESEHRKNPNDANMLWLLARPVRSRTLRWLRGCPPSP